MKKSLCHTSMLVLAAISLHIPLANAAAVAESLAECRQQQNALKRLVCYDAISIATAAVPVESAAASQAVAETRPAGSKAAAATTAAATDFGLEHKKAAVEQTDQMYLTVSSISYSPRKELIVVFDDGQIWRQTGSGVYTINVGERHYIKRGMLNSFLLGNDENNRTIKVRRVE